MGHFAFDVILFIHFRTSVCVCLCALKRPCVIFIENFKM